MPQPERPGAGVQAVEFKAVSSHAKMTWSRPASYAFIKGLSQLPVADSEVLLASHHLPIAIGNIHDEPRVVALTSPSFQRTPVLSPTGQWARGYMPIALRCLPFRFKPGETGPGALEIATNIKESDGPQAPVFGRDGGLSAEVQHILALLQRLEAGKSALQRAAEKLLMADVVAPFHLARVPAGQAPQRLFFTVDQNRFAALPPSRAALLVKDDFLTIDLAIACVFSQRLMTTLIALAPTDQTSAPRELSHDWDAAAVIQHLSIKVDDSELFPFDRFAELSASHDRHN